MMEPLNQPLPISSKPSKNTPTSKSLVETPKMKQDPSKHKDEDHQKHRNTHFILDLSLSNGLDQENQLKDTYIDRYNVENHQMSDKSEPRILSCNYCQRKFYSSQALGGHQNAHKKERRLKKCGQRVALTTFGNYYHDQFFKGKPFSSSSSSYPYPSNVSPMPLYGSYNNHTSKNHMHLGIKAHSLIHKPSSYLTISTNGSSTYHGLSRMPMVDQQPGVGRLGMVPLPSSSSSSNGGVARFDGVVKNSQTLDRSVGEVCWKSSINVCKNSNKQDHDKLHNLDLSLKL